MSQSQLPDGWELLIDASSGADYFVNSRTGEWSWEAPAPPPTETPVAVAGGIYGKMIPLDQQQQQQQSSPPVEEGSDNIYGTVQLKKGGVADAPHPEPQQPPPANHRLLRQYQQAPQGPPGVPGAPFQASSSANSGNMASQLASQLPVVLKVSLADGTYNVFKIRDDTTFFELIMMMAKKRTFLFPPDLCMKLSLSEGEPPLPPDGFVSTVTPCPGLFIVRYDGKPIVNPDNSDSQQHGSGSSMSSPKLGGRLLSRLKRVATSSETLLRKPKSASARAELGAHDSLGPGESHDGSNAPGAVLSDADDLARRIAAAVVKTGMGSPRGGAGSPGNLSPRTASPRSQTVQMSPRRAQTPDTMPRLPPSIAMDAATPASMTQPLAAPSAAAAPRLPSEQYFAPAPRDDTEGMSNDNDATAAAWPPWEQAVSPRDDDDGETSTAAAWPPWEQATQATGADSTASASLATSSSPPPSQPAYVASTMRPGMGQRRGTDPFPLSRPAAFGTTRPARTTGTFGDLNVSGAGGGAMTMNRPAVSPRRGARGRGGRGRGRGRGGGRGRGMVPGGAGPQYTPPMNAAAHFAGVQHERAMQGVSSAPLQQHLRAGNALRTQSTPNSPMLGVRERREALGASLAVMVAGGASRKPGGMGLRRNLNNPPAPVAAAAAIPSQLPPSEQEQDSIYMNAAQVKPLEEEQGSIYAPAAHIPSAGEGPGQEVYSPVPLSGLQQQQQQQKSPRHGMTSSNHPPPFGEGAGTALKRQLASSAATSPLSSPRLRPSATPPLVARQQASPGLGRGSRGRGDAPRGRGRGAVRGRGAAPAFRRGRGGPGRAGPMRNGPGPLGFGANPPATREIEMDLEGTVDYSGTTSRADDFRQRRRSRSFHFSGGANALPDADWGQRVAVTEYSQTGFATPGEAKFQEWLNDEEQPPPKPAKNASVSSNYGAMPAVSRGTGFRAPNQS